MGVKNSRSELGGPEGGPVSYQSSLGCRNRFGVERVGRDARGIGRLSHELEQFVATRPEQGKCPAVDFADVSGRAPNPRIGLFGGTFDPPHVGHLVTAVNVRHALGLDRVIVMVANVPWQKEGRRSITPAADRQAMVTAAVRGVPGLEVGTWEIEHGGPSYTADTLAALKSANPDAELFTIVGDDAAAGLETWERFADVVTLSRIVVVDRPGAPVELPSGIDWLRVEVPRLEVSSTDLRARFHDGRPLDYLVTDSVLAVIRERGLYTSESAR